jgi:hypothetical protein
MESYLTREMVVALQQLRLAIQVRLDSFAQHTAAALQKPSVVLWIANIPGQFGYEMHTNIVAAEPTVKTDIKNSVFTKYNIVGPPSEFPYNSEDEIFNEERIISAILEDKVATAPHLKEESLLVQS